VSLTFAFARVAAGEGVAGAETTPRLGVAIGEGVGVGVVVAFGVECGVAVGAGEAMMRRVVGGLPCPHAAARRPIASANATVRWRNTSTPYPSNNDRAGKRTLREDAGMDELTTASEAAEPRYRLTDTQALGALGAWYVFRLITGRIGVAVAPKIYRTKPWLIPFMTNAFPQIILAGTGVGNRWGLFVATTITSVVMSTMIGLIYYWAGWRFGHRLAEMSAKPGSPWASIWNPKQIARVERWMDSWGIIVVFLGRATEHFTVPITLVAGASEMRFRRFIVAHVAGAIAFAVAFLTIGRLARERWPWLPHWISHVYAPWAFRIGIASIGLLVIAFVLGRFVGSDDQDASTTTPSQPSSESPPENS